MATLFQQKSTRPLTQQGALLSLAQITVIVEHAKSELKKACVNKLQHAGTHLRSAAFFNPKAKVVLDDVAGQMIAAVSGSVHDNESMVAALDQVVAAINNVPPPHSNLQFVLSLISERLQQAKEEYMQEPTAMLAI